MKTIDLPPRPNGVPGRRSPWIVAVGGCIIVLLLVLRQSLVRDEPETHAPSPTVSKHGATATFTSPEHTHSPPPRLSTSKPAPTAQEIVASKVVQFARGRRELAHAMADHFKIAVPDEFERFFDAAEAGRYDEMKAIYTSLRSQRENGTNSPERGPQWRAIVETQGAADAAHDWPAQKLLDYGNAILGSLRPGMVYVGGTDPGCFIPTMLNDTSDGERHIVLTQSALADSSYLDYLDFLYSDRMATLTKDDSQRAFQNYLADAQKRLQHDQQFPNEPKQIRPGEDVRLVDNRVQVSGQMAVISIKERLFQTLMEKNPDASFAIEQSFPSRPRIRARRRWAR